MRSFKRKYERGSGLGNYVKAIPGEKLSELEKGLFAVGAKYAFILRFGIETGLRVSDCLSMRVRSFSKRMNVFERKTGKYREIEISERLFDFGLAYIAAHELKPSDALFPTTIYRKWQPLTRQRVWGVFRKVADEIGLEEIGPHSMRKTYAMNVLRETGDIKAVQRALMHTNVDTTMRYLLDLRSFLELVKTS